MHAGSVHSPAVAAEPKALPPRRAVAAALAARRRHRLDWGRTRTQLNDYLFGPEKGLLQVANYGAKPQQCMLEGHRYGTTRAVTVTATGSASGT